MVHLNRCAEGKHRKSVCKHYLRSVQYNRNTGRHNMTKNKSSELAHWASCHTLVKDKLPVPGAFWLMQKNRSVKKELLKQGYLLSTLLLCPASLLHQVIWIIKEPTSRNLSLKQFEGGKIQPSRQDGQYHVFHGCSDFPPWLRNSKKHFQRTKFFCARIVAFSLHFIFTLTWPSLDHFTFCQSSLNRAAYSVFLRTAVLVSCEA